MNNFIPLNKVLFWYIHLKEMMKENIFQILKEKEKSW